MNSCLNFCKFSAPQDRHEQNQDKQKQAKNKYGHYDSNFFSKQIPEDSMEQKESMLSNQLVSQVNVESKKHDAMLNSETNSQLLNKYLLEILSASKEILNENNTSNQHSSNHVSAYDINDLPNQTNINHKSYHSEQLNSAYIFLNSLQKNIYQCCDYYNSSHNTDKLNNFKLSVSKIYALLKIMSNNLNI